MTFDEILDAPDTPTADTIPADTTTEDTTPDAPSTETPESAEPDADGQTPTDDQPTEDTPTEDTPSVDASGDGRTIPNKWKELFKGDKELKSLFFSHAEFKKAFESPAKAKEFLQDLEAAGGVDALKQASNDLREIDAAIAAGDSKIVERFAQAEGFKQLVPSVMQAYAKADEPGYTHMIASTIQDTLQQSGFLQGFEVLKSLVGDNPQAKALLEQMGAVLNGVGQLAKNKPEAPKVDPEREKLNRERQEFEQQKAESFRQGIATSVANTITTGIKSSLQPYLKGRNADASDYSMLERNVNMELGSLLAADKQFQKTKDALLLTGDKAKITACMEAAIQKHLPAAAKKVGRLFGASQPAPAAPKKEAAPASNATVQKVSTPPAAHEVDWSRTTQDDFLDGKAVLKNGRKVTF